MKVNLPNKRVCTFKFANGTKIRVSVPFFDHHGNLIPFEAMLSNAKTLSWNGDETEGRGTIRSFKIGNEIHAT